MNEEDETIKNHLKNLLELNGSHSTIRTMTIGSGEPAHPASEQELKELNREELFAIADLLGMSDLYLNL